LEKGEAAFRGGDYAGAVYAWRHAVVDDPQDGVVTMLLGQALFATGRFDEAAGATQAAMHRLPREQWGLIINHYAELYGKSHDYTSQLRALERAIKEKPNDPALRFLAGFHYSHLGFTRQAIDQLDRLISIAPRDEMARQLRDEMRSKLEKSAGGMTNDEIPMPNE
jgi:tetratricopeptide (TPR) repeat protein